MSFKHSFLFLFNLVAVIMVTAQEQHYPLLTEDSIGQKVWVDSVYTQMSVAQRIGQLFMVDVFSEDPKEKTNRVLELVKQYHIGGVIFSKGGPVRQAKLNNKLQNASKIPLLVGMDAEWGLSMRLDSTYAFPWNMTLGAIQDNNIIEEVGAQIGKHCKRLGVHINFGPVVDINVNPKNPIIGNRSFGAVKENVTQKALAIMKGMQSQGVMGSAKHFPGHGDTDQDSHKTLPTLDFSRKRLDSIEMYPYQQMVDGGIESIMVGHLNVPNLVPETGFPTSISEYVVTSLLRDSLQFKGLVFTDALNMKGASDFKSPGEIDLAAFKAGNDILLISEDIPSAAQKIKEALESGELTEERLAYSVKKILYAKYKVGLHQYTPVDIENLYADLNTTTDDLVYSKAIEAAITITKNSGDILPVKKLEDKKIAYVSLGDDSGTPFYKQLNKYTQVDHIKASQLDELITKLEAYNYVIVGFHRSNANPWKSYAFTDKEKTWLYEIARLKDVVLDLFVRPYAILDINTTINIEGIIHSYQNSELAQEKSAQLIFGAIPSKGKLPVSLGIVEAGTGYESGTLRRLSYGLPQEVGFDAEILNKKVDSLVNIGLWASMMPGAQVLIARKGKVVYNKPFGYHTYSKKRKVKDDDLYDLASLTKILGTLPPLMELRSQGSINLDNTFGELLPELKSTNKSSISIKEALSHYGRFQAWIPFYLKTIDAVTNKPSQKYYRSKYSQDFGTRVAEGLYLRTDYQDSIIRRIGDSDLRNTKSYKYSDLPYYLLKKYIEGYYGKNLHEITQNRFYKSLGANYIGFSPLYRFSKNKIVPTENDTYWRNQKIQGFVHDMGAAMLDRNIGGHAGLFSNANDVAKIMQMYLQNGYYGDKLFISKETIDEFNTCHYCDKKVRRGVGFDKPQLEGSGPTCGCVSFDSFGHSGFTGTYTWADPDKEIVYVFLSNRTFPDASNRKLIDSGLRTKIQEAIYESLID